MQTPLHVGVIGEIIHHARPTTTKQSLVVPKSKWTRTTENVLHHQLTVFVTMIGKGTANVAGRSGRERGTESETGMEIGHLLLVGMEAMQGVLGEVDLWGVGEDLRGQ